MNAKVNVGGVVTLPGDVIEELGLKPGSRISFERGPKGKFVVGKVEDGPELTFEQVRDRLANVAKAARLGLSKEFAGMTTDEYMEFIRGD
jgi:bifunctional DNA-binding transcriptional regulator/antitoxin component of YhaV-PrlF toxin-antitoxin module